MRVLWLCNVILPIIADNLGKGAAPLGGWLTGMLNPLINREEVSIGICFPIAKGDKLLLGQVEGIKYYGFPENTSVPYKYDRSVEQYLKKAIDDFHPDIVHIFGTEYPHSLAMTKVFGQPDRMVINIQGLASVLTKYYYANVPSNVVSRYTFRDFVKQDNIRQQKKKFSKRGIFEIEALNNVNHVIGRTDWDEACTSQINPNAQYHFCNETLRDEFYKHTWDIDKCDKYSIFLSQVGYPIKGFHYLLEAMPQILKRFPETQIYTTGNNVLDISRLRISSYHKYIAELIVKNKLEEKVHFLGFLNEYEMCQRFLKSHVFVSPSIIENESNSVSEAKILGVPVVASYVGGVTNRITNGVDGYIYQHNAPYMLAYYICKLFNNNELSVKMSVNARKHAIDTHSIFDNTNKLMSIYTKMLGI